MPSPRRPGRAPLHEALPGAAGMLTALVMLVLAEARYLGHHREDVKDSPVGVGPVRGAAAVTVLLSLASVVVVLGARG